MWAFTKALLAFADSVNGLTEVLRSIRDLYKLELEQRFNIRQYDPDVKDETEITYPKLPASELDRED